MNTTRRPLAALLATALCCLALSACQETRKGLEKDTDRNLADASRQAEELRQQAAAEAKEAGERARAAAARAQDQANAGIEKAAEGAAALGERAKVEAAEGAAKASDQVVTASQMLARKADGARRTLAIQAALTADKSVDAKDVHVESDPVLRVVHLGGSVPSAEQRAAAVRIATTKLDGYSLVDELTVAAPASVPPK